jgi:hypothetical protein
LSYWEVSDAGDRGDRVLAGAHIWTFAFYQGAQDLCNLRPVLDGEDSLEVVEAANSGTDFILQVVISVDVERLIS